MECAEMATRWHCCPTESMEWPAGMEPLPGAEGRAVSARAHAAEMSESRRGQRHRELRGTEGSCFRGAATRPSLWGQNFGSASL